MGIGTRVFKDGHCQNERGKPSNDTFGDMLIDRIKEQVADAESAAALAQQLAEAQRVYEGYSLNMIALMYGINATELDGIPTTGSVSTGRHYMYIRNGQVEVWKATSTELVDDPATGNFVQVLLSSTSSGDDDGDTGTTPSAGTITVKEINLTNVAIAANTVASNTITADDVSTWFMAQVTLTSTSENLSYNVRIRDDQDNIIYESMYKNTELNDKDMFSINEGNVFKIEIENLNQSESMICAFSMKYVVVT